MNNQQHIFRTSIFRYSPKKLKLISREIRSCSIEQAIGIFSVMKKKCSSDILKSLFTLKDNIDKNPVYNRLNIDSNSFVIRSISVEKKIRGHGLRIHARGRFARSNFNFCRLRFDLNAIIKNDF